MAEWVGWIGLGKMGQPMSERLAAAGYHLVVFDVDCTAMQAARAAGGQAAGPIGELAAGSDIVFSMIPDDAALRYVALGPGGVLAVIAPEAVYVDMSTVSPQACAAVRTSADAV